MIKYIGSKRTLVPRIVEAARALPGVRSVADLFSGTSRVGHALKRAGFRVVANDHNAYAHTLARCYVAADRGDLIDDAERVLAEFNTLIAAGGDGAGSRGGGFFTESFCVRSRYFHPANGARIERVREEIARRSFPPDLEAVLLTALLEAADRVDSTVGLQMAYLKAWAPRAGNALRLRVPDLLPRAAAGKGEAWGLDALEAAAALAGPEGGVDAVYIDPPYNQHSYLSNYHVWETLVRWDAPELYGTACKRADCRTRKSPFNSKVRHREAFTSLIDAVAAPYLIVSFSDEGFLPREDVEAILSRRGRVETVGAEHPRYNGARIGIYNASGEKVGKVGRLRNTEYLCVVGPHDAAPALSAGAMAVSAA